MSRVPDNVWGAIETPDGSQAPLYGEEPEPSGSSAFPQRVACYICHNVTRTIVYVAGTSYCLEHTPPTR